MKKVIWIVLGFLTIALIVLFIKVFPFLKFMNQYEVAEYDKNLTLVMGGGGNSAILIGEKEVLVVESKISSGKDKLYALVKEKAGSKSILLVNTHFHSDHAGGNELYKGNTIIAGAYTREDWIAENGDLGIPTEWIKEKKEIQIGNETVILQNIGQAHTRNDMIVYFKNRKMIFMGDLLMIGLHPFLKEKDGSRIANYLEKQNKILQEYEIEKVIPGHGPIGGKELIQTFQTYFFDTKTVAEGKSDLKQVEEKYKDWVSFLSMASTEATVNYWKKELAAK